ncbi:MAG: hypothetical protein HNEKOMLI_00550 [Sodalis sp. Psp]|nr:hypothetical protein [Sodalis sp. Psp]MCR3757022.1 hypothetical protein [Sodalis sp. Ppy]
MQFVTAAVKTDKATWVGDAEGLLATEGFAERINFSIPSSIK